MLQTSIDVVDGHRLRVARLGDGTPLVLLHGYPDTLQVWSALAPLLAAHFQVIAFDWPGMGESEAWSGGATPYDLGRRLLRLLDAWGGARATIAAHDMGGQAALAAALLAPERVERLVVMNSLVIPDAPTSWEIALLRRFGVNRWLLRHAPRAVFHRAVSSSIDTLPHDLRADFWHHFAKRDVREFIVRMCAGYEGTLAHLAASYASLAVPLRIVWGERDRHFPLVHAQRLHDAVRGSQLHVIEGAGHWMAVRRADEVARAIG